MVLKIPEQKKKRLVDKEEKGLVPNASRVKNPKTYIYIFGRFDSSPLKMLDSFKTAEKIWV